MLNFSAIYIRDKIQKPETELYYFMDDILNDNQLGIDSEEIFLYDPKIQVCEDIFQHMFDEMNGVDE